MEDQFYNDDFERYLQQQVKQHRMYASDAVWKGIYTHIHGYRKWPGLNFIAILIVAALTVCTVFMQKEPVIVNVQEQPTTVVKAMYPVKDNFDATAITHQTFSRINNIQPAAPTTVLASTVAIAKDHTSNLTAEVAVNTGAVNTSSFIVIPTPILPDVTSTESEELITPSQGTLVSKELADATEKPVEITTDLITAEKTTSEQTIQIAPGSKKEKWQLEFYITPSMSYRRLVDEKPADGTTYNNLGFNASNIKYKPGMGTEIGLGVLYALNNNLKVKAGAQFNIRQYNIEAYTGNYEKSSITLVRGGYLDTVTTYARFKTSGGYGETELLNKYYQVSVPIGIEYSIVNNKRFGVNISGSIQPTYTFSQSSYLLTTDYKNYTPGLTYLRKWNYNSGLEATISYKIGDFQWKLGPQLRYQHLPTYSNPYPIKEYLIDYGFRIGFTKSL